MLNCTALQWGMPGRPLTPPLNLRLETGSLTALVGANGSGKSSLLKVIAGWQEPLAGTLSLKVPRLGGIGYLPQQSPLDRQFPIDLAALAGPGLARSGQRTDPRREHRQGADRDGRPGTTLPPTQQKSSDWG
ncbi:hypothetical protein GCM10027398_15300 [Azotobacter salinestris]